MTTSNGSPIDDSVIVPTNSPDDSGDLEVSVLCSVAREATKKLERDRISATVAAMFSNPEIPSEIPLASGTMPLYIPFEWAIPIRLYGWVYCGFDAELFYTVLCTTVRELYGIGINDSLSTRSEFGFREKWQKNGDRMAQAFVTKFRRRIDEVKGNRTA